MLVVVFGVIMNDSVLAKKQICRCNVRFGKVNDLEGLINAAAKSCQHRFYCYQWFFKFYCEVTVDDRPIFQECCKAYSDEIIGTWCREIYDSFFSVEDLIDPVDQLKINAGWP